MEHIIFACDIDNTLIFSKKHPHDGWPCVEWIHEKEQAYMSPKTCELLRAVCDQVLFVPVTSRSAEQYARIQWPENVQPHLVISTHGAKLFVDGMEDAQWQKETFDMVLPWLDELHRLESRLAPDPSFIRCRMVDDAYLFVYCAAGVNAAEVETRLQSMTDLKICVGGKKIYLLPPDLNKGTALKRLRLRFPQHKICSAGDSEMDLDMLNEADYAMYPESIAPRKSTMGCCCSNNMLFSEFILEKMMDMARR